MAAKNWTLFVTILSNYFYLYPTNTQNCKNINLFIVTFYFLFIYFYLKYSLEKY